MTPTDSSKILGNIKWHVVGLCETKEDGKGLENFREEGVVVYETGKSEDNPNALLINKNFTDNVEKIEKHADRIISCKIKHHGKTALQIIQVYTPTYDYDNEIVELFYEELEKSYGQESLQPPHSNG